MKQVIHATGKVRIWVRDGDSATCQDTFFDAGELAKLPQETPSQSLFDALQLVLGRRPAPRSGTKKKLLAERDELLLALQFTVPALEHLRKIYPRSKHDDSIDVLRHVTSILAKATGEAP